MMKTFMLSLFLLIGFVFSSKNNFSAQKHLKAMDCATGCVKAGQLIFDALYIDQGWSYHDAHEYTQNWMANCYARCGGYDDNGVNPQNPDLKE